MSLTPGDDASAGAGNDASPEPPADASPLAPSDGTTHLPGMDLSPGAALDVSPPGARDASPSAPSDVSRPGGGDGSGPSPEYSRDVSPRAPGDARACGWCGSPLTDPRARYCSKRCRQTAWRARERAALAGPAGVSLRAAYADPPYPGRAHLYRGEASYAGEVDHRELLARLVTFDGWALSTAEDALQDLLPLCPKGVRVCPWVKPNAPAPTTAGLHSRWEPVIVVPARRLTPGKRDWLLAQPARGGGDLVGRKPLAFCAWLFELLGLAPGDDLVDLYPGTGVVGRAWREASRAAPSDASWEVLGDG